MVLCLFYRFVRSPLMLGRKEEERNLKRIKNQKLDKSELAERVTGEQLAESLVNSR